jgi:hypothetical protein
MILRFLLTLHDSGRAELAPPGRELAAWVRRAGTEADETRRLGRMLEQWHGVAVLELPGPALAYHPEAALGGALLLQPPPPDASGSRLSAVTGDSSLWGKRGL